MCIRDSHNTIDDNKVNKNKNKKYITTVYCSLLPSIISKVFSKFNIKVAFKTNNNISNLLCIKPVSYTHLDVYKRQTS